MEEKELPKDSEKPVESVESAKKKGSNRVLFVVLGCLGLVLLACCALMVLGIIGALGEANDPDEEGAKNLLEEIKNEVEEAAEEEKEPVEVSIDELAKCDGSYEGEKVVVTGYFQTPFSVFCYGTCTIDFASKFDAPSSASLINANVDYTETDGANTVNFPSSYTDITDFTFLDKDGMKLNVSKPIVATGTWQFTDNSDDPETDNYCKLSVEELVQK